MTETVEAAISGPFTDRGNPPKIPPNTLNRVPTTDAPEAENDSPIMHGLPTETGFE